MDWRWPRLGLPSVRFVYKISDVQVRGKTKSVELVLYQKKIDKLLCFRDSLAPPTTSPTSCSVAAVKQQSQAVQSSTGNASNNSGSGNQSSSGRASSPPAEPINVDGGAVNTVAEWEPPRALWPTEWKVRPSTSDEREEFRRQERMRYAAPHKAFTYRMHGYASVVGPVKGIYQHNVGTFVYLI